MDGKEDAGKVGKTDDAPRWGVVGMTLDEAATALRVERRTVMTAIRDKGLPARKVGRSWRISPAALDAWLSSGEAKAEASGEDEQD